MHTKTNVCPSRTHLQEGSMRFVALGVMVITLISCSSNQPQRSDRSAKSADSMTNIVLSDQSEVDMASGPTTRSPVTVSNNVLMYAGRPTHPRVEGNNSLEIKQRFRLVDRDLYLVQDTGGTACPATFYVAEVGRAGFRISSSFGTCSDLIKTARRSDALSFSMPGFKGPFESESDQEQAALETHTFVYENGSLEERVSTKSSPARENNCFGRFVTKDRQFFISLTQRGGHIDFGDASSSVPLLSPKQNNDNSTSYFDDQGRVVLVSRCRSTLVLAVYTVYPVTGGQSFTQNWTLHRTTVNDQPLLD